MKHFAESVYAKSVEVMDYNHQHVNNGKDWQSEAVTPFSEKPEEQGLYFVTTLDRFFQLDLEQSRNGNGNGSLKAKHW